MIRPPAAVAMDTLARLSSLLGSLAVLAAPLGCAGVEPLMTLEATTALEVQGYGEPPRRALTSPRSPDETVAVAVESHDFAFKRGKPAFTPNFRVRVVEAAAELSASPQGDGYCFNLLDPPWFDPYGPWVASLRGCERRGAYGDVAAASVELRGAPAEPALPGAEPDPHLLELATWLSDLGIPVPAAEVGRGARWKVTRRLRRALPVGLLVDEETVYRVEAMDEVEAVLRVAQRSRAASSCPQCLLRVERWTEEGEGVARVRSDRVAPRLRFMRRSAWSTVDERTIFSERIDWRGFVEVRIAGGLDELASPVLSR